VISQRVQDWLRERRIKALVERAKLAFQHGHRDQAREVWNQAVAEINARSPGQVERMERARGLRT
jgi:hypothetical protein